MKKSHPNRKNPVAAQLKQQSVVIEDGVMDYFKNMATETGVSYQNLINLYLHRLDETTAQSRVPLVKYLLIIKLYFFNRK